MRTLMTLGVGLVLAVGLGHGNAGKDKHAEHIFARPADLKWGPAAAGAAPGAQVAVLVGDPSKAGPFTIRAKLPDGYTVPAHTHPTDENVTVLKGAFLVGRGDQTDVKAFETLPEGSFMHMPKGMRHYVRAKGEVILQIHSVGPLEIHYVNESDDPRNKGKSKK